MSWLNSHSFFFFAFWFSAHKLNHVLGHRKSLKTEHHQWWNIFMFFELFGVTDDEVFVATYRTVLLISNRFWVSSGRDFFFYFEEWNLLFVLSPNCVIELKKNKLKTQLKCIMAILLEVLHIWKYMIIFHYIIHSDTSVIASLTAPLH